MWAGRSHWGHSLIDDITDGILQSTPYQPLSHWRQTLNLVKTTECIKIKLTVVWKKINCHKNKQLNQLWAGIEYAEVLYEAQSYEHHIFTDSQVFLYYCQWIKKDGIPFSSFLYGFTDKNKAVTWQNPPRQCPCPEHWLTQVDDTGTSQNCPKRPSYLQSHSSLNCTFRAYASFGSMLHQPGLLPFVVKILSRSAFAQSVDLGAPGWEGKLKQTLAL